MSRAGWQIAAGLRPITDRITYTTRSGMAAGLRRRGGLGFLPRPESEEEKFFVQLAPRLRGKTVYDIGCYEGIVSLWAARAIGANGRLVIVEPHPESQRRTTRNLSLNRFQCSIQMVKAALGDREGTLTLSCPKGDPARSSIAANIQESIASIGAVESHEVRVAKLDTLLLEEHLPAPDFIKIDTEGAESAVLLGAENTIRTHMPSLYIEMHGESREAALDNQRVVHSRLRDWGYQISDFSGKTVCSETEHFVHIYCTPARPGTFISQACPARPEAQREYADLLSA